MPMKSSLVIAGTMAPLSRGLDGGRILAAAAAGRQGPARASGGELGRLRLAELPLQAVLATVLAARGELDAADAAIVASGVTGEIPDVVWFTFSLFARGVVRFAQGRFEQAAVDLLELERRAVR